MNRPIIVPRFPGPSVNAKWKINKIASSRDQSNFFYHQDWLDDKQAFSWGDFFEKRDKYWDLARELTNICNVRATMISVVIGVFGSVPTGSEEGLEEIWIRGHRDNSIFEIGQKTERVQVTCGILLLLRLQWETSS